MRARPVPLFAAVLLAVPALPGAARAAVWTGAGASKSWNDAANWAEGAVPFPAAGLDVAFEAPGGASFGFKGPFRAGRVSLATNSGPVSLRAEGIVLGGSVNAEPETGWIAENEAAPARLANAAADAELTLEGGVAAGWDLEIDASGGGPVVLSGGFDPAGRPVTKTGPGPLVFRGGRAGLAGVRILNGPVTLDGAEAVSDNSSLGDRKDPAGSGWTLRGGARLELASTSDRVFFRGPFALGDADAAPPAPGAPRDRLVGNGKYLVFCSPSSFAPGARLENAGNVQFAFLDASATNPVTVRLGSGLEWSGASIRLGGWPDDEKNTARSAGLSGTRLAIDGATVRLTGDVYVGGYSGEGVRGDRMELSLAGESLLKTDGAVRVPDAPGGSSGNALRVGPGARLACAGLFVGEGSSSNLASVSGAKVAVGKRGIDVGLGGGRDCAPAANSLLLRDRAAVKCEGELSAGRSRDKAGEEFRARGNRVSVLGGSRLETAGARIGIGVGSNETDDTLAAVSGPGSVWSLAGRELVVGSGRAGPVTNAVVLVRDGGAVEGVQPLRVGAAGSGRATGCRFIVEGGRVSTSNEVTVGTTADSKAKAPAVGNLAAVGGRRKHGDSPARPGLWDFGGGALRIGCGHGWNQEVKGNRFEVRPGGRVLHPGPVHVGNGGDGAISAGNTLALLGGTVDPVPSLFLGRRSVIEIAVDPSLPHGTSPLLVEGNVDFGSEPAIRPLARPGAKPGLYPVLVWKGDAKGDPAALRLDPAADASRWELVVDAERKRVGVRLRK